MWTKSTKNLAKIFETNLKNPGLEAPTSRSGGFWAALGRFLITRDLPDTSRTPSRRLWGGSWGRFWLILVHLGGVLGAQDGPKILPRRPKIPLRCLQDSPRSDFQQKSREKLILRVRMVFSIRFKSDFISKIHPQILKNHLNYIGKISIFSVQAVLA